MNIIKDSKVLIILGNGHNLALGLRTSYADFGKLYIKQMIKFSESKLCNDLVKSYYSAPQSWNNLEQKIKEFALSFDPINDNVQIEYIFFDWLRKNLGWYMDGEAKYWFLINPTSDNKTYHDKLTNSLPYFMFQTILNNDYRYDILSFNYTWLKVLLNRITCDIYNLPPSSTQYNYSAENIYESRFNINYVHLSGNNCILGIDDDKRVSDSISFLKKAHQFNSSNNYPLNLHKYKSILIYGHSLGESDTDFMKLLFADMMDKDINNNPKLYFVTYDSASKHTILNNLTKHLRSDLSEIQRHIEYDFIITNEIHLDDAKTKLSQILFEY